MKGKNTRILKDKIIINILDYLEKKEERYKNEALIQMKDLAKIFKIKLKNKIVRDDLYICLKNFIKNEKGYINTLVKLNSKLKEE